MGHRIKLEDQEDWKVPFNSSVRYTCEEGTWIENDTQHHPNDTYLDVECLNVNGTYNIPEKWPNCTHTVNCGPPPEPPTNGTRYMNHVNILILTFLQNVDRTR